MGRVCKASLEAWCTPGEASTGRAGLVPAPHASVHAYSVHGTVLGPVADTDTELCPSTAHTLVGVTSRAMLGPISQPHRGVRFTGIYFMPTTHRDLGLLGS